MPFQELFFLVEDLEPMKQNNKVFHVQAVCYVSRKTCLNIKTNTTKSLSQVCFSLQFWLLCISVAEQKFVFRKVTTRKGMRGKLRQLLFENKVTKNFNVESRNTLKTSFVKGKQIRRN